MPELERILTWQDGTIRAHQILVDEPHQPRRHVAVLRRHRLHGAAMEGLPLDRPAFEHRARPRRAAGGFPYRASASRTRFTIISSSAHADSGCAIAKGRKTQATNNRQRRSVSAVIFAE